VKSISGVLYGGMDADSDRSANGLADGRRDQGWRQGLPFVAHAQAGACGVDEVLDGAEAVEMVLDGGRCR